IPGMRTDLFDFELPPGRIALRPAVPRDAARLVVVRSDGTLEDRAVRELPQLLAPGDQVVVNDTKVIPATLHGRRIGRAGAESGIEATLHRRLDGSRWRAFVKPARKLAPGDVVRFGEEGKVCFLGQLDATVEGKGEGGEVTLSFAFHGLVLDQAIEATLHKRLDGSRWRAFVKPARKLAPGDVVRFGEEGKVCFLDQLDATVEGKGEGGEVTLSFAFHGPVLDQAIEERGDMPLPPYIAARRPADERDRSDYQTLFAQHEGSVAAPTAGLHFTDELVAALAARGIGLHKVTLHVGAGTFLPVKVADTAQHRMHAEQASVSAATADALNAARTGGGRIVPAGSTSLRLVETAADESGRLNPFDGETALFITPGYRFRAVDVLMTHFHLPRSTLFMLVAAFAGLDTMKRAYAHAVVADYRFYSNGDACLLFRAPAGH